jgi:hypothetical protein
MYKPSESFDNFSSSDDLSDREDDDYNNNNTNIKLKPSLNNSFTYNEDSSSDEDELKNVNKKNSVDDSGSLSDSETETIKKYKKMRYSANETAFEALSKNVCESNNDLRIGNLNKFEQESCNSFLREKKYSNNNILDVIKNNKYDGGRERRITRHNSEGNFDKLINLQNMKKKSKKLGKSSNVVFKLDYKKYENKPLRSTKSGLLNVISKQKHNKHQNLHKFDSEKCISSSNFGSLKYMPSCKKNFQKKFKSNSYVDQYDFYENFKLNDDHDDSESEDESKNNIFFLKSYTCGEIADEYLHEYIEELVLIETVESKIVYLIENNDQKFELEIQRVKVYAPTFIQAPYFDGRLISFHKFGLDQKFYDETPHEDEIIVAHILNSTDDEHSFQITIMTTEIESVHDDDDESRFINYTVIRENNGMDCEEYNGRQFEIEAHDIVEENRIKIKDVLNDLIDSVVLNNERHVDESIFDSETIIQSLNKIKNTVELERHLNEKFQINEILTLLCENAIINSKINCEKLNVSCSNQALDPLDNMDVQLINNDENTKRCLLLLTDSVMKIPENTENVEFFNENKNLLENDIKKDNLYNLLHDIDIHFGNDLSEIHVSKRSTPIENTTDEITTTTTPKRKQIEIKLNMLNTSDETNQINFQQNETTKVIDGNQLVINFNIDFSNFPGFRIGKATQHQIGNNTHLSLMCDYIENVLSGEIKSEPLIHDTVPLILLNNEFIEANDIIEEETMPDEIDEQEYVELKNTNTRKPRPSYLIEKNNHIFGGDVDDDEDDEFFISSGAVYQSWPYIYEPGFKLIPIIEMEEINHVLSKSDNVVYGNYYDNEYNSNDDFEDIDDNELADYELPSYSLKNFGINLIHVDEKKVKKKKRKRIQSRSIDNLQNVNNECYYFSTSSVNTESDSEEIYSSSDSSDDSDSIREYKQRHAIGFSRNLNSIALNGTVNKFCSHLDLLYENPDADYMASDDQFNNPYHHHSNIIENLKKRQLSLKQGRLATSYADNNFLNRRAIFFSEKQLDGYNYRQQNSLTRKHVVA